MMKRHSILFFLVIGLAACINTAESKDPAHWTEEELNSWFSKKNWLSDTSLLPDASISKRAFAISYHKNKDRWNKAFDYLRKTVADSIIPGIVNLDGENVFVKISAYNSKKPADVFYETHRQYADIHYVHSGTEYIGIKDIQSLSEEKPYNAEKDISFFKAQDGHKLFASHGTFFIFFPGEVHRPALRAEDSSYVQKIVIKIKI